MNNNPTITPQVVNSPFTNFCMSVGAIPTSYKDSLDYYETLLWLIKFLDETIIPAVTTNGNAVAELQGFYLQLQSYVNNYFDNLDVQEEINNKLDEMVEDGTLQEIIASYLNSKAIFGYDNVESMKNATNLINGSYAQTLGFYNKNDGGNALYKIRQITNEDIVDEMFIFALNDTNLIAELITNKTLHTKQAGLKGDNSTDETIKLNHYFSKQMNNYIIDDGTYIINDTINLPSNCTIKGCGNSIIKLTGISEDYFMFNILNKNNIVIENIHLIGNRGSHEGSTLASGFGFNVMFSQNITIRDCIAEDLWCDGFYVGNSFTEEKEQETKYIYLENCKAIECGRNGFVTGGGENITITDCYSYKTYQQPGSGLDIEPEGANTDTPYLKNINIINFISEECQYGISIYARNKSIENINISNHLSLNDNKGQVITATYNNSNIVVNGVNIINSRDNGIIIYGIKNPANLLLKNIIIDGCSSEVSSSDITKGGITLWGLNNDEDTLDNIIIDNITYKNSRSDYDYYYLIGQNHFHLSNLLLKNIVRLSNQPKIAIYNVDKVKFENTTILEDGSTMTLGRYNIFNKMVNNKNLTAITNLIVSDFIPNGIYEIYYMNNTVNNTAAITFNDNYTVYQGTTEINKLVYSYKKCSYCRFMKQGTDILILDTSMTTTTPDNT